MESVAPVHIKPEPIDDFADDGLCASQSIRSRSISDHVHTMKSWHVYPHRRLLPMAAGKLSNPTPVGTSVDSSTQPEDLSIGCTRLKTGSEPALDKTGKNSGLQADSSASEKNSSSSPSQQKSQTTEAGRDAVDQQFTQGRECPGSAHSEAESSTPALAIKQEPDSSSYDWQASSFDRHVHRQAVYPHPHRQAPWNHDAAGQRGKHASKQQNKLRIRLADIKTEPEPYGDFPSQPSASDLSTRKPQVPGCADDLPSSRDAADSRGQGGEQPGEEEEMEALPVHFPTSATNGRTTSSQHHAASSTATAASEGSKPSETVKYYQCGICLQAFEAPVQLKNHMTWHITSGLEKPIRCGACAKRFRYCSDLIQHSVVHTGERNHRCEECQATFTKASSLKEHAKTHTGERPFKCEECAAEFKHSSHLKAHRRIHTGEKPYQCDICQVFFTSRSYLKLHRRIHTGERRFKCGQCSAEFNQALHLETHMRIHTGEKPFRCDLCGLTYRYKSSLKSHVFKVHCSEKPYKCTTCPEAFRTPEALKTHCKTHECGGEKPFKCGECSSTFLSSAGLYQHKWIHTGEKPFKCDFCPAAFRDSTTLKRHKVIHMGERPFKCEHCCASFKLLTHLSCHLKIHSDPDSYFAAECEEALNLSLKVDVSGKKGAGSGTHEGLLRNRQGGSNIAPQGDTRSLGSHMESDDEDLEGDRENCAFKVESDDDDLGQACSIHTESDEDIVEAAESFPVKSEMGENHVEKGRSSNGLLS